MARLYHCETKYVNRVVKRNIERFPKEFCFQLTENEFDSLRSQNVTLKNQGRGQHRKYLPYVFTEQGVAMLSAVLHSNIAIQVSINIINAFIEMRTFILNNQMLFDKISNIVNLFKVKISYKNIGKFVAKKNDFMIIYS